MIYNVPAQRLRDYRDQAVIVRATDPATLLNALTDQAPPHLVYGQLLALPDDLESLLRWPAPLPLDLHLAAPATDFARLYHYARLVDGRPLRVSLPVVPGFSKAVRLAVALGLAVKLDVGQPAPDLIPELTDVLDLYLHQTTVSQPVDYFHGTWLAMYQQQPVPLWTVQEDDPAQVCYVADDGTEQRPGRLAATTVATSLLADLQQAPALASADCGDCPFFAYCGGYFKWPRRDYDCAGVKRLFATLETAATEIRQTLADFDARPTTASP